MARNPDCGNSRPGPGGIGQIHHERTMRHGNQRNQRALSVVDLEGGALQSHGHDKRPGAGNCRADERPFGLIPLECGVPQSGCGGTRIVATEAAMRSTQCAW